MTQGIRWPRGVRSIQMQLESMFDVDSQPIGRTKILFDRPGRRRLMQLTTEAEGSLFVKQMRGVALSAYGMDAAAREWRALTMLHRAGVAVPEPLALGTLANGDRLLATRFLDGVTFKDRLVQERSARSEHNAMLGAIGRLVRKFHETGFVHRDLHWGNILITASGPVLLDLQSALPLPFSRWRLRDLGSLDYSVSPHLSISDRTRLRAAALGIDAPFGSESRRALRAVGDASHGAARSHAASRTRRSLRPGRQYASIHLGSDRGLRRREVSEPEVAAAFAARDGSHSDESCVILKSDARARVFAVSTQNHSLVVKEYRAGGWTRRVADLFRGSPALRAWRGGHGLLARGSGAALPMAFVERRRFGIPIASAIVLEDLRALEAADECSKEYASEREVLRALARLASGMHRRGVIHGDLKASHVLLERDGERISGRLIDLEGVRFHRRLSDRQRIHALAQLNASLPDRISDEGRLRAFDCYAAAFPFRGDRNQCLREIVAVSLERHHRWTGSDCAMVVRDAPITPSNRVSER